MLPKWHIFYGILFTLAFWLLAPETSIINLSIIFLASILVDLDHYIASLRKTKSPNIQEAYNYNLQERELHKQNTLNNLKTKRGFRLFHTFEFHIIIALLGILWTPLFFVFIGMLFHSVLDVAWMLQNDMLHTREFFFFRQMRSVFF